MEPEDDGPTEQGTGLGRLARVSLLGYALVLGGTVLAILACLGGRLAGSLRRCWSDRDAPPEGCPSPCAASTPPRPPHVEVTGEPLGTTQTQEQVVGLLRSGKAAFSVSESRKVANFLARQKDLIIMCGSPSKERS